MTDVFGFMRNVYFFNDLEDADISFISKYTRIEKYPAGHLLFHENDPAQDFYVISEGSIEIWKHHGLHDATLLSIQGTGHIFGEMALVDDQTRSATVITCEPSEFLIISHKDLVTIMKKRPPVMFAILRSLSNMIRRSNELLIQNLSKQNNELQKTNQDLKVAQAELVRAERFSNLGKFASFILHDLRNPIAMIRGYSDLISLEVPTDSPLHDYARKITTEADQLNRFASELLDYTRGDIRLNYVVTALDSVFHKLQVTVRDSFERRGISLIVENEVKKLVMIDSERLLRALINLVDNARKASSPGKNVRIRAYTSVQEMVIEVRDEGEGMDEEVLSKIYEPFYSRSSKGGTGLGMLIVKNVIEAHQGVINIESHKGVGTLIVLRLPMEP